MHKYLPLKKEKRQLSMSPVAQQPALATAPPLPSLRVPSSPPGHSSVHLSPALLSSWPGSDFPHQGQR